MMNIEQSETSEFKLAIASDCTCIENISGVCSIGLLIAAGLPRGIVFIIHRCPPAVGGFD